MRTTYTIDAADFANRSDAMRRLCLDAVCDIGDRERAQRTLSRMAEYLEAAISGRPSRQRHATPDLAMVSIAAAATSAGLLAPGEPLTPVLAGVVAAAAEVAGRGAA